MFSALPEGVSHIPGSEKGRRFSWPSGVARVLDEEWVRAPVEELARKYDSVEAHGWYKNLDRTVADIARFAQPGQILVDYSGGTGILTQRILEEVPEPGFGIMIVDASPKFLRLALEKLKTHERVAFRWIRYLKEQKRLQQMQEILEPALLSRGVDGIVSTNAIHLYYGLQETLDSWKELLRPSGRAFIQSGNIGLSDMPEGSWIIDETVEAIHEAAMSIVREDSSYQVYRTGLDDTNRMARYDRLRHKFFLPVRPLDYYLEKLEHAGFRVLEVSHVPIEAQVEQWYEFLSTYHEGVLGWIGGSSRVEARDPSPREIEDRLCLIRAAMSRIFGGCPCFQAIWTYINIAR